MNEELKEDLKELTREIISLQIKLQDIETKRNLNDRDIQELKADLRDIKILISETEEKLDEKVGAVNKTLFGLAITFVLSMSGAILSYILNKF